MDRDPIIDRIVEETRKSVRAMYAPKDDGSMEFPPITNSGPGLLEVDDDDDDVRAVLEEMGMVPKHRSVVAGPIEASGEAIKSVHVQEVSAPSVSPLQAPKARVRATSEPSPSVRAAEMRRRKRQLHIEYVDPYLMITRPGTSESVRLHAPEEIDRLLSVIEDAEI